jgi:hypothetical protein
LLQEKPPGKGGFFYLLAHRIDREVMAMCRRNQLFGIFALGFGLGMLFAGLFESGFFCGCVGVGLMAGGLLILQKK